MKPDPMFPWISKISLLDWALAGLVLLALLLGGALTAVLLADDYLPDGTEIANSGITFVTATPRPRIDLPGGQAAAANVPAKLATPRPYYADANEMGKVMVLEYHRITYPERRYQRSPDNFRADLQRLYQGGYYPVNFIDMVYGFDDVPPGKKPVVLTFDDSDISQFRVLEDRTVDADSAVGILLNFHAQHQANWPLRGTFFVLGDDSANHIKLFGQPKWSKQKLKVLAELGFEIGSHTVSHADLSRVSAERIEWELAVSKHVVEELVPDYTVRTMSVPYGGFPWTDDFLKAGSWGGYDYVYEGNVAAWGGPSVSPHHSDFDPYRVSRIEISQVWVNHWFTYFEQNPHEYYVADGDPDRLTYPQPEEKEAPPELVESALPPPEPVDIAIEPVE